MKLMDYYCLEHYNQVKKTNLTYDDVLIEIHKCKKCGIDHLCVVDLGHEHNYLVNMHFSNRFYHKMLNLTSRKRYHIKRK